MFLHIGNNVLIKKESIIGIFNISALAEDIKGKKFLNEVRARKDVRDISSGKQTSIVLTDDGVYISRISTATLQGRSRDSVQDMLSVETIPEPEEKGIPMIDPEEAALPIEDSEDI
jgi:extracellular matrix regulatory protein B